MSRLRPILPIILLAAVAVAPAPSAQTPWVLRPSRFLETGVPDPAALLPPPPAPGGLEAEADLEAVLMAQAFRTPDQEAWARYIDTDELFKHAPEIGPWFRAEDLPVCKAFFDQVLNEVHGVSARAKRRFDRPRPPRVDGRVRPCVPLPRSSSYPSGHATQAYVIAGILGELLPDRREALDARAHRAAWSRIIGGVHFPTDDAAGRRLAAAILEALHRSPTFRRDLEACRRELDQARARRSRP